MCANYIDQFISKCGLQLINNPKDETQHTVATRSFSPGDVLLSINPLFAFPVRKGEEEKEEAKDNSDTAVAKVDRCVLCFNTLPVKHPRCSQCRTVEYCSLDCLSRHWSTRHYFECKSTTQFPVDEVAAKIKPMYRPYLRMAVGVEQNVANTKSLSKNKEWMNAQLTAWDKLVSHQTMHPKHVLNQYHEIASMICQNPNSLFTLEEQIVTTLCRFGCNNFAAYDEKFQVSGHLCSPLVSLLLNHSCYPNATFEYEQSTGKQVARALCDIEQGQEITLAYVDGLRPRSERQQTLSNVYFFDCKCSRCTGFSARAQLDELMDRAVADKVLPWALPVDFSKDPALEPWVVQILDEWLRYRKESCKIEDKMLDIVAGLNSKDMSFTAYKHWLACQEECLDKVAINQVEDVLRHWACVSSMYVLAFYMMSYPPSHPLLGRQCLRAALLAWNSVQTNNNPLLMEEQIVKKLVLAAQDIFQCSANRCQSTEQQIASLLSAIKK